MRVAEDVKTLAPRRVGDGPPGYLVLDVAQRLLAP